VCERERERKRERENIRALVIRQGNGIFSAIYIILSPVWPVRFYCIFPHYFINGTIFEKQNLFNNKKMCILISTIFSETFVILRRMQLDIIVNVKRPLHLASVILVTVTNATILIKIEHHRQIFQESTNIIFHENSSIGRRVASCEYTN
jgi:hypothetical protein